MLGELVAHNGATALQYCAGQGDQRLREHICDVMALEGIAGASADDVVITVGSQQALDLVTRIFSTRATWCSRRARATWARSASSRAYQAEVVHVADGRARAGPGGAGVGPRRAGGGRPAGQVPLHGAQLPQPGRRDPARRAPGRDPRVCAAVRRAGDRGQPVRAAGLRRPAAAGAASLDAGRVVYLGSFSKTFAPGSGSAGRTRRRRSGTSSCWPRSRRSSARRCCPSSRSRSTSRHQPWREQIKTFRELYRERRDAMLKALEALMPAGCTGRGPRAGSTSG